MSSLPVTDSKFTILLQENAEEEPKVIRRQPKGGKLVIGVGPFFLVNSRRK